MNTLSIGTISSGTLRIQDTMPDLVEAFESVMDPNLDGDSEVQDAGNRAVYQMLYEGREPTESDHEIQAEIIDRLQEHAPEYCYVGALEGDGAEIGVYPDWDRIEMDEHDGELERINDAAELDYCNTSCAALLVNDHGNVTLFLHDGDRWESIWSVV